MSSLVRKCPTATRRVADKEDIYGSSGDRRREKYVSLSEDELVESLCGSFQSKDSGEKVRRDTWWEWYKELKAENHRLAKRIARLKSVEDADAFYRRYQKGEERPKKSADEKRGEEFQLADGLMAEFNFLTTKDNEELWVYENGVWRPEGKVLVKARVEDIFQEDATIRRTNEVVGHIERATLRDRDVFNSKDHLVNLENGVLDLAHNPPKLLEHDAEFHFTYKLPILLNPDAECPNIEKFFQEVLKPEDVETMEELFGYCLLRSYPFHKLFFWYGKGRNGKSKMKGLLEAFLGEGNISNTGIQELIEDKYAPAELFRRLANISGDLPDRALRATGIVKCLTGQDRFETQMKYQRRFGFTNYAKCIFLGNELPEIYDRTLAWWQRMRVISFPNQFLENDPETDPYILKKLTTEEELSGLLNLTLKALQRLLKRKGFKRLRSSDEEKREYLRISAPALAFMQDCVKADDDGEIEKEEFYQAYCFYYRQNKLKPGPEVTGIFTGKVKQYAAEIGAYITLGRASYKGRPRVWKGISWKDNPLEKEGKGLMSKDGEQKTLRDQDEE